MALENPAAAAKSRSPRARLVRAAGAAAALGAAMICLAAMVFRDKLLARLNPPPALAVAPVASGLRQLVEARISAGAATKVRLRRFLDQRPVGDEAGRVAADFVLGTRPGAPNMTVIPSGAAPTAGLGFDRRPWRSGP